ncbi:MAG: carboxypeptidase-like regulatory domain-containing protein, partial [Thermoplasmata archaeon]|nr:carboxypeptidase-like regulatory domain-containing protein [Thermoplasmata archaeon]
GLNPGAPAIVRPIILAPSTVQGFLYWNVGHNASYLPHVDPLLTGARVSVWGPGLPARYATTDASGAFVFRNVPPGVYNFTVIASGANYTNASWRVFASAGKLVNQTEGLTPSSVSGRTLTVAGAPVAGALVTVSNATGSIATTTTNSSGGFSLLNLAPGNFSIIATATANGLSSSLEAFQVSTAGQKLHTNLTLQRVVHIELTVVYSGNPVPSFPVRFTPIVPLAPPPPVVVPPNGTGNNTSAPPPSNSAAQTNSSVFFTNANGQVDAILPARNYSIYGLGLVGGQWLSGFASAYAATTPTQLTLAPLFLAPAIRLTGHAGLASGTTSTGAIQLTAYTARGDQVSTFPNTTGAWSLWLPSGVYSISAVEGATQAKVALYASLTTVDLVSATALNLTLSAGVRLSAIVGAVTSPGSSSGIFPAYSASVQVALSPNGGTVTALANASGNVSLVVPAAVAPGQSYCVSAQAFGFEPYSNCGLSPSEIAQVSTIPMTLRPVAVNVTVLGTPAQVNMTLNFTANSSTARTISTTGGPQFSLTLEPGNYRVTGWAPASPSGLLLPDRITTVTIPVGARTDNVTFSVTQQVKGSGTLNLPPNAVNTSVTVHLSSSVFNVTLSGDDVEGKFFVAPGNYQVFAETTVQGVVYATLANVSVNATG